MLFVTLKPLEHKVFYSNFIHAFKSGSLNTCPTYLDLQFT